MNNNNKTDTYISIQNDITEVANDIIKDLLENRISTANIKDDITMIMELILKNRYITKEDVMNKMGIGKTKYHNLLKQILVRGLEIKYSLRWGYKITITEEYITSNK